MDRADYEAGICQRLEQAERIPFKPVSFDGWEPSAANCHDNVNQWVGKHQNERAVRGWVTNGSFGAEIRLVAHSVVRGVDGKRFDITPVYDEANRGGYIRQGMKFVEHLGSDEEFFALERERHYMTCPQAFDWSAFPSPDADEELSE